ncbi:MAG: hypothetical protein HPY59_15510 [Anaerolineae bacterium]|nr:hypothetical protein [Anaerolineae bacterium]
MNTMQRANLILKDLKNFTAFLGNLWGGFAVFSIIFPFVNNLVRIIPLRLAKDNGVLLWFTPELFTAIATLISLSIILAIYRSRNGFILQANLDRLHNLSWKSFGLGVTLLLVYLTFYFFLRSNITLEIQAQTPDSRRLLVEAVLLFLYSGSFAMITRGFALLATGEYLSR